MILRFRFIRSSRGMSLLEVLLALSIFAFMFVFISRAVKQNYRQANKLSQGIRSKNSFSHSLSMMRRDLRSLSYFVDIHENLAISFPPQEESSDEETDGQSPPQDQARSSDGKLGGRQAKGQALLFSPYFVFEGGSREIQFVSYTYSALAKEPDLRQWLKIRYHVEDCPDKSQGLCLIRSANPYWDPLDSEDEWQESLALLRNLQSIEFSYAEGDNFLQNEWEDEWQVEQSLTQQDAAFNYPYKIPFPSAVRMEIDTQKLGKELFLFSISSPFLKAWNPDEKAYSFPVWKPPTQASSKKQKPKREPRPMGGQRPAHLPSEDSFRQEPGGLSKEPSFMRLEPSQPL